MICQFSFKNYKSYKNDTVFDMQASNLTEHEDTLIKVEGVSELLPVSAIYGPNGGGKSNLIQALSCLISLVVSPIRDLNKNRVPHIFQTPVSCEPYLFDVTSRDEPTEFSLFFRTGNYEYRYAIALVNDIVVTESLHRKKFGARKIAMLFERDKTSITLGPTLDKKNINKEVNPKMPYLSFLAINYNIPSIVEVQIWFENCVIRNYSRPEAEKNISVFNSGVFKDNFICFLNDMGIDITDYEFSQDKDEFILQRTIGDHKFYIPFNSESDGTKKLFACLPVLMIALAEGRLVIIDELDAKLHPKLLRYIISLFTDASINLKNAQLIFTTHDLSTMKNDVFRRDEIWFAALDMYHSSEIYSLDEIRREDGKRINHTASYDKQYLEGRYGADPYLSKMMKWEVIHEQMDVLHPWIK